MKERLAAVATTFLPVQFVLPLGATVPGGQSLHSVLLCDDW